MAWHQDSYDNAIVIDGFQNGIADSPYDGISDLRNVLVNSVPGEVSVGFSTGSLSAVISAGTLTSVSGNVLTITGATNLESGMALSFGTASGYSGFSAGTTVYWVVKQSGNMYTLYSNYQVSNQVSVTGSGSAGFTVYSPDFSNYQGTVPNRVARSPQSGHTFLQDSKGRCWSNKQLTTSGYWVYLGNVVHSGSFIGDNSNGNGIVYYQPSGGGAGYVFLFSDSSIDYFKDDSSNTIVYGWNPASPGSVTSAPYLNSGSNSGVSHEALVGQDNVFYYCDGSFLGSIYEKSGQTFNPATGSTYTFSSQALGLPSIDSANCLAEQGVNLLVGGTRNLIYPWNRTGIVLGNSILNSYSYPIWLSESVVQKMVTVNTNTYIFVGNRGRIHVTNGSQAQPWAKIPDHLSGTVEPYFLWGGAVANKNQLYFSVAAINNANTANTNYGAIWGIDLITQNLRVVNQMSYGSYSGLATALFAITPLYSGGQLVGNPTGAGLYMGWCSGSVTSSGFTGGTSGIDQTSSTPFINSQAYIDSDLIPIGTFDKPNNFNRIEYLLTKPLVSGESIDLQWRSDFSQSFTDIFTDSTVGNFTNGKPINFKNVKWIQIRAILNSTVTNPSYVRLKHIRLTAMQGTALPTGQ